MMKECVNDAATVPLALPLRWGPLQTVGFALRHVRAGAQAGETACGDESRGHQQERASQGSCRRGSDVVGRGKFFVLFFLLVSGVGVQVCAVFFSSWRWLCDMLVVFRLFLVIVIDY